MKKGIPVLIAVAQNAYYHTILILSTATYLTLYWACVALQYK
jgi:hypothetical protein